jgi:putative addiction module component (TIGR02574 family)
MHTRIIDIEALDPVQRMELADVLYDSAMQVIEASTPALSSEQISEIDRRLDRLHAGQATLIPSDEAFERLLQGR